ncbi:MAG TPA: imelysin family protein [Saprospiraceae bacterium]|nr:imelysin family protein [Saprospiraceae bacterium]
MKKILLMFLLLSLGMGACKKDEPSVEEKQQAILDNYAAIVLANYEDVYNTAEILKNKIDLFVADPTEFNLATCKQAWLAARIPYGQSEAFRFYGGPIDDADGPEGLINAWPMDENFIDYVQGNANAGLINNPAQYPDITKQVLIDLNESISESSIFTGYHAIEFLLWGQDFSTSEAGSRPYTDYVVGGTASNQARRGQYLKVVAELLLENLAAVRDEWKSGGTYRTKFLKDTPKATALGYLFISLGELSKGELAGERMFVAVDTQDQENEHSCFSDNTIADIQMNFKGLQNVYYGEYTRTDGSLVTGKSLASLASETDKDKAAAVSEAFANAQISISQIPVPFDQAILNSPGPQKILTAVADLRTLSDRLTDVGFALGAEF